MYKRLKPLSWCLASGLLMACQPQSLGPKPRLETVKAQLQEPSAPAFSLNPKPQTEANVRLQGNTLIVDLQLPALPPEFRTQALDLSAATKIVATTTSSRGQVYQPNGAVAGEVNYPVSGVISLTFSNVVPDEVLLIELQVKNATVNIVQADLAVALRHNGINNLTTGMNFQTTAVAKTMKALVASNAGRARTAGLLTALNTLMLTITGRSGTSPNFSYTTHPSLVKTALLATALETQDPGDLTAADYRGVGGTVNLTVSGLVGPDRINVQVTDAASAIKNNLGNGFSAFANATPGNGLKLVYSEAGSNLLNYTFVATPATFNYTEGGTRAVTLTATPVVSVSNFSPSSGTPDTVVTITGSGFTGATAVRFNGVNASSFTVNSNTQITATVPITANDGVITVVNGESADSATSFNVFARLYVRANATGANNGQGWANAYTSLQSALTASRNGDEIWVAAGTYKPHASDVAISFNLKDNVDLYGGFAGNESVLTARNPAVNFSILSGDLQNDDNTSVVPYTSATANTEKLVQGANNVILDGFTLRGASGDVALLLDGGDSMTLENLVFSHNNSPDNGAGFRCIESSFTLKNSRFNRNDAFGGGGMAMYSCMNATVDSVLFENNQTISGGANVGSGLHVFDSDNLTAHNLQFKNNQSNGYGALSLVSANTVSLSDSSFENNTGFHTAAMFIINSQSIQLSNTVFKANQSANGALYSQSSSGLVLSDLNFESNQCSQNGCGAHLAQNQLLQLRDSVFKANSSSGSGTGAVHIEGAIQAHTLERLAFVENTGNQILSANVYNPTQTTTSFSLKNVLMANNSAANRLLRLIGDSAAYTSIDLRNVTLANNLCSSQVANNFRCPIDNTIPSVSTYQNILFWKDQMGPTPATVGGNIDLGTSGTPFANSSDPDGADNTFFTADDGFRLNASATAALNTGISNAQIPSTDISGQSRVGNPDPGAYEYPFAAPQRRYVRATATGLNNGTSWTNAYTSLQTALNATGPGDEIWVASGTYRPHVSDRNQSFELKTYSKLYGGFAGSETLASQRNPLVNRVILSGDLGNNDTTASVPSGNIGDNSFTVLKLASTTEADGFTVQGGNNPSGQGGGILVADNAQNVTLSNLTLQRNAAQSGGGMSLGSDVQVSLEKIAFAYNYASLFGGGLDDGSNSELTGSNLVFANNHTAFAGGGFVARGTSTLYNVTFSNNTSADTSGGMYSVAANYSLRNALFWNSTHPFVSWSAGQGNTDASVDPFVNPALPAGTDGRFGNTDDGLRIKAGAAVINTGVTGTGIPSSDFVGINRVSSPEPGAYEYP